MGIGRLVGGIVAVGVLVTAAGVMPADAITAQAVTGQAVETMSCLNDTTLLATVAFTVQARSVEELEGPHIKVVRIEASNPCGHTIEGVLGVRDTRSGRTFDVAFNVRPGSSVSFGPRKLEAYGLNRRYRATNSFGSATNAAVPGPGVVVIGTF